jgi:putative phosphoesterase
MKIGIVSDTHGRHAAAEQAAKLLRERGIDTVLHCGDVGDGDTVRLFQGFTIHLVFGNTDWDREGLQAAAEEIGATFHERFGHLELEGVLIAFLHGDDAGLLDDLERSGAYDYLFHGHTHVRADRQSGRTRVINPGALHRARPKTFAVLELATGELETVVVE